MHIECLKCLSNARLYNSSTSSHGMFCTMYYQFQQKHSIASVLIHHCLRSALSWVLACPFFSDAQSLLIASAMANSFLQVASSSSNIVLKDINVLPNHFYSVSVVYKPFLDYGIIRNNSYLQQPFHMYYCLLLIFFFTSFYYRITDLIFLLIPIVFTSKKMQKINFFCNKKKL